MIPECNKVIKYGNSLFGEGSSVSVKLMDKPEILFGKITDFNVCGFFLEMSISEQSQAEWIDFSQVESIEKVKKKVEVNQIHPESLQAAAEIVRNEFLQRGEWYNALVSSIGNCLEGIIPVTLEKEIDLAKIIVDRIVGLEE